MNELRLVRVMKSSAEPDNVYRWVLDYPGFFHRWVQILDAADVYAIVEDMHGQVHLVESYKIVFARPPLAGSAY